MQYHVNAFDKMQRCIIIIIITVCSLNFGCQKSTAVKSNSPIFGTWESSVVPSDFGLLRTRLAIKNSDQIESTTEFLDKAQNVVDSAKVEGKYTINHSNEILCLDVFGEPMIYSFENDKLVLRGTNSHNIIILRKIE